MKFKTLAALCKRNHRFIVYDLICPDTGELTEQWMGDGRAAYALESLPALSESVLCAMLDITAKQKENIFFSHTAAPTESISFRDFDQGEKLVEPQEVRIIVGGYELISFMTRQGLVFIDAEYITPLTDVADNIEYYHRVSGDNRPYIVAKVGMFMVAVIMPHKIVKEELIAQLELIAHQSRQALDRPANYTESGECPLPSDPPHQPAFEEGDPEC